MSASGEGLKLVPVNKPAYFAINTKGATSKDLQVSVIGPSGRPLSVRILEERPNAYKAEYTPQEVGEHSIDIAFFDKAIRGSPFKCYAYDARQIRVGPIPNGFVGKPVEFESKSTSIVDVLAYWPCYHFSSPDQKMWVQCHALSMIVLMSNNEKSFFCMFV